jgi:hypothetical protein
MPAFANGVSALDNCIQQSPFHQLEQFPTMPSALRGAAVR